MSPGEGMSPTETKISSYTEDKVAGTGSTKFASGLLWVLVDHPLIPGPINFVYKRKSTLFLMLIQRLVYPLGEPCPSPVSHCHLAGTVTESSKGHSTNLSSQLLQDGEEHGRTSTCHKHGLWMHFICCEVSSLIRSNACSRAWM